MSLRAILIMSFMVVVRMLHADDFIKDAEPAILEVRYTRIEVTDTTQRDTQFFKDEMMLRIGQKQVMFCNAKRYFQDSLLVANSDAYWGMMAAEIDKGNPNVFATLGGHKKSYIFKNYSKNQLTEEDFFDMTPWRYKEEIEIPEWIIGEDTKMILGYECNKATADFRGRKWIAWFAPEIPVQEGPWKLCGLPGLILEAYDGGRDYVFESCGIMQNGIGDVGYCQTRKSDSYFDVSRDEFFKNWWRFKHSNSIAKIKAAFGVGGNATPKEKQPKTVKYDKEETNYPHDL